MKAPLPSRIACLSLESRLVKKADGYSGVLAPARPVTVYARSTSR